MELCETNNDGMISYEDFSWQLSKELNNTVNSMVVREKEKNEEKKKVFDEKKKGKKHLQVAAAAEDAKRESPAGSPKPISVRISEDGEAAVQVEEDRVAEDGTVPIEQEPNEEEEEEEEEEHEEEDHDEDEDDDEGGPDGESGATNYFHLCVFVFCCQL